uniref:Uncharacterized protein n=1 Tax=Utricularia reniformis TaxID=192314 RepID=A0A1Y0B1Q3_9LAMI|nr:hypothetical protein AEK19_MT1087 [Utricularia reniformis]ART31308.1 hypothetical protein AEK19_MT1087 [Utricularia reniformis]
MKNEAYFYSNNIKKRDFTKQARKLSINYLVKRAPAIKLKRGNPIYRLGFQ